jgi:short subunit dehydrogenase-like uncharacterized protein
VSESASRGHDSRQNREYDLVLFGATGFTGGLTADYLAAHAPDGTRWALAGRDATRLRAVRDRLAATHPDNPHLADLPLLVADVTDRDALRAVTEATRVVATTVGPYSLHGQPLLAACAANGTDYCDLTGEPAFVDRMYLAHHARAAETGARLLHACGFDSIPHDLGAYFTVRQLPDDVPIRLNGYVRASGGFSGGTLASFMLATANPRAAAALARQRRQAEGRPEGRRIKVRNQRPGYSGEAHAWIAPLPSIDPQIVARSAAALPEYGPDFTYGHHAAIKHLPVAAGIGAAVTAAVLAGQTALTRRAAGRLVRPGDGPGPERRAKAWFTVRFAAQTPEQHLVTEVSGGDPGYGETAKMLAQTALSLAFDEPGPGAAAGQLTTAAALGTHLIDRLTGAGITFTTLDGTPNAAPGR